VFNPGAPKPLVTNIHHQMRAELPAPAKTVRLAMALWTGRVGYLHPLSASGAQRHDLDGNPVEPVTDAHREHARQVLEQRAARRETTRKEPEQ
jgi:ProP effector